MSIISEKEWQYILSQIHFIEDEKRITCYNCEGDEIYACKSNEFGGWSYCEPFKAGRGEKRKERDYNTETVKSKQQKITPKKHTKLSPNPKTKSDKSSPKRRQQSPPNEDLFPKFNRKKIADSISTSISNSNSISNSTSISNSISTSISTSITTRG